MRRTRVKICCIASLAEAEAAIAAGADALGLVSAMPSGMGVISDDLAREIACQVPPPVATFLLTSRERGKDIADHVRSCGTNTVQIVRHISVAEHAALAELLPRSVRRVQVVHVEDARALELLELYRPYVHAFLLDSGRPSATVAELGGTGRVHDWGISREFIRQATVPVFLAGGLRARNVETACRAAAPYGVDVCSGIRSSDGKLDAVRLAAFMAAVRASDAAHGGT